MFELIEHLRRLPKQPMTVQGGVFASPREVRGADGLPFRPLLTVWMDAGPETPLVIAVPGGEDPFPAAFEALGRFVEDCMDDRACPQRLEFCDPELAEDFGNTLQGTGIEVSLVDQLPLLDAAASAAARQYDAPADCPPSVLDAPGMTNDRVRAFKAAAAEFYQAAPWGQLSELDLIQIESPQPPDGMAYVVVVGSSRQIYGLQLYPSRAAYEGLSPGAQVRFRSLNELPVAGDRAHPLVSKDPAGEGEVEPLSTAELTFLEGAQRALAATSEEELDSGRWSKEITTFDGPVTVSLAIPDLLEPPSDQEWTRRGFAPDPRIVNWMDVYGPRYLAAHPPATDDRLEMVEACARLFEARKCNNPLTQPCSPADEARERCFEAFRTHGRRRVQLARQALGLDPTCTEAHVILAEQAATLDDKIDLYRRGVEVAEQSLGSAYFAGHASRFSAIWPARSYMCCRLALAESLAAAGRMDEAIAHYNELLRLDPEDDLCVRYVLLTSLLSTGRDREAARLSKQFDDASAFWAYSDTLLAFRLSNRPDARDRELRRAMCANSHVPELLCSDAPLPQPTCYAHGSENEACFVAAHLRPVFAATPGALEWLASARQRLEREQG